MIEWISEHLQFVITVAILFAGWVAQRLQKGTEEEGGSGEDSARKTAQPGPPSQQPAVPVDEQVRRIQEEIRRKIQERAGGGRPPATPVPRPITPPPVPVAMPRSEPVLRVPTEPYQPTIQPPRLLPRVASLTEEQEAELRRLEARRREVRKVEHAAIQSANAAKAAGTEEKNPWASELRDPSSLRRALVLREILGPPVSMRE